MVQSEQGKDQFALLEAVGKVVERRPEVLLKAFRSGFKGTYFIETPSKTPKDMLEFDLKGDSADLGRPLYLLIIAPSREEVIQFEKTVLQGLEEDAVFQPTIAPLVVNKVEFESSDKGSQSIWNRYGPLGFMPNQSNAPMLFGTFIERADPREEVSLLRLRLSVQPQSKIPLMSPEKLGYQVERTTFRDGRAPSPISITLQPGVVTQASHSVFIMTYPFQRPAPYTWDAYRIRMQAGLANLGIPGWVSDWSTKDDRSVENGNRTLNLGLLVETMVRAITENVVFLDQFILLGRGN
jgi:hypothetical protein